MSTTSWIRIVERFSKVPSDSAHEVPAKSGRSASSNRKEVLGDTIGCFSAVSSFVAPKRNEPCDNWTRSLRGVLAAVVLIVGLSPYGVHADALNQLTQSLDRVFSDERFEDAQWGVQVESLESGKVIYRKNGGKLLVPASNQKLLTGAAILLERGPNATFDTLLYRTGPVEGGVLKGDLVIQGGGDPSIGGRFHKNDLTFTFRQWAQVLKQAGITRISGSVVGDDNLFDDRLYGDGWQIGDLAYWYAAGVSALNFNDNCIDIVIRPGKAPGKPARFEVKPSTKYLKIVNNTRTVAKTPKGKGALREIDMRRNPDSHRLELVGPVLTTAKSDLEWASVPNPTLYTATVVAEVLRKEGVQVDGSPADIDDRQNLASDPGSVPKAWTLIHTEKSPPLSDLLAVFLKRSQNLYGECFLKYLGTRKGKVQGTFELGVARLNTLLQGIGVSEDGYRAVDGSGLSRKNLVTPAALCSLLRGMTESRHAAVFKESLTQSGREGGTLKNRMKGTVADGKVFGKTGYINRVRTLSGYVEDLDGETFIFSFLANNYRTSNTQVEKLQDRACILLAGYSQNN